MDFATMTSAEVDALQGADREAYYAWRKGDLDKLDSIGDAYGRRYEAPEGQRRAAAGVETPETKPRRSAGRAARDA